MTAERRIWAERVADRLLRRAAARAPLDLAARLEEEWRADMADRPGHWSRLRFALGCCWATTVIASDYGATAVPATAAGQPIDSYREDGPAFSPRTTTFLLVASLHAAILFALITMHSKFASSTPPDLTVRMVDEVRRSQPPVALPQIMNTRISVVEPEIPASVDSAAEEQVQTAPADAAPAVRTAPPAASVARVQGGPGSGFPSADDYYPSAALLMGEQGVATVRACVDPKGRLTAEPSIVESSGSRRLDEGALRLAKAGSGHYRASSEDGRAVDSCYPFRIRFSVKQ